jgi:hypothetical protein
MAQCVTGYPATAEASVLQVGCLCLCLNSARVAMARCPRGERPNTLKRVSVPDGSPPAGLGIVGDTCAINAAGKRSTLARCCSRKYNPNAADSSHSSVGVEAYQPHLVEGAAKLNYGHTIAAVELGSATAIGEMPSSLSRPERRIAAFGRPEAIRKQRPFAEFTLPFDMLRNRGAEGPAGNGISDLGRDAPRSGATLPRL